MKTRFFKAVFVLFFAALTVFRPSIAGAAPSFDPALSDDRQSNLPAFSDFVASVSDGASGVVRGVYAPEHFALRVFQQRSGNYGYVSSQPDVATQFALARQYGVIGLLAHNYLAGAYFTNLEIGDQISIIYGDGKVNVYEVAVIYKFRAVDPFSGTSNFIDLSTNKAYTARQVFDMVYTGGDHVTLQTCIAQGNLSTWGRLFILAYPLDTSLAAHGGN